MKLFDGLARYQRQALAVLRIMTALQFMEPRHPETVQFSRQRSCRRPERPIADRGHPPIRWRHPAGIGAVHQAGRVPSQRRDGDRLFHGAHAKRLFPGQQWRRCGNLLLFHLPLSGVRRSRRFCAGQPPQRLRRRQAAPSPPHPLEIRVEQRRRLHARAIALTQKLDLEAVGLVGDLLRHIAHGHGRLRMVRVAA